MADAMLSAARAYIDGGAVDGFRKGEVGGQLARRPQVLELPRGAQHMFEESPTVVYRAGLLIDRLLSSWVRWFCLEQALEY